MGLLLRAVVSEVFSLHSLSPGCQALHMEANVEPKQDPDLKIEWFLNGKILEQAHRYKTTYDFGLVTLDLNDAYERDQGIYTCRAYNKVCRRKITTQLLT